MKKLNLLIIFGGASPEYYVSCSSAADIVLNMSKEKYNVYVIGVTRDGLWYNTNANDSKIRDGESWLKLNNKLITFSLNRDKKGFYVLNNNIVESFIPIDVVFPIIHGETGESGEIYGVLDLIKLPYVGSNATASSCCMDKKITRMFVDVLDIPQPKCYILRKDKYTKNIINEIIDYIDYFPMFIKPDKTGSSVGISKVNNLSDMEGAINEAFKYSNEILIEKGIIGSEIKVAIIGNKDSISFGSIALITCKGGVFNTYETKYTTQSSTKEIPAKLSEDIEKQLLNYSRKIYNAIGCSSFARIDFFLKENKIYFNEINNVPGFSENSIFCKMFKDKNISYVEQIDMLIESAFKK